MLTNITVYVDDLILLADMLEALISLKQELHARFHMKDLGELAFCLGISVLQGEGWLQIHQKLYMKSMLERFGMQEAYAVATPVEQSVCTENEDDVSMKADKTLYQQIVRSLQNTAGGTRPDIAHVVKYVARYATDPSNVHMTAAKRILRYLKGIMDLALTYEYQENDRIVGYSDSDWAGDCDDRKSTSGNVFILSTGAIACTSRKQSSVALLPLNYPYNVTFPLALEYLHPFLLASSYIDLGSPL